MIRSLVIVSILLAPAAATAWTQDEIPAPHVVPLSPLPRGAVARLGSRAFCHAGPVGGVAYTPDGERLVSVGFDKTLRIWDAASGAEISRIAEALPYAIGVVTIAADPRYAIVSDGAGSFARFDLQESKLVFRATGGNDLFAHAADGSRVAAFGPAAKSVHVHDAQTDGHLLRSITLTAGVARSAALSADGARLAYGAQTKKGHNKFDATIVVENAMDGAERFEIPTPDVVLASMAFTPDGSRLAVGGNDGCLYVVDVAQRKLLEKKKVHDAVIIAVRFAPDGKTIATGSNDTKLALLDANTFEVLHSVKAHATGVRSIDFTRDGSRLATGSFDSAIAQWNAETLEGPPPRPGHVRPVSCVVELDEGRVATSGYDGDVIVWHDGKQERRTPTSPAFVHRLAFAPATRVLAAVGQDTAISLWDDGGRGPTRRIELGDVVTFAAAFSHDGARLAIGCADGTARILRVADGAEIARMKHDQQFVTGVAWSQDDAEVWTADSIVHVWSAKDGAPLRTIEAPKAPIQALKFAPDGKSVAVAAADARVHVYDASSGAELLSIKAAEGRVKDVAFSPDGAMIAACGESEIPIGVWKRVDGAPLATFDGHEGPSLGLAFSADGTRLYSASTDDTVLVWDVSPPAK